MLSLSARAFHHVRLSTALNVTLAALSLSLSACSGSDDKHMTIAAGDPVYVGATRVFTVDNTSQGYLYRFSSLEPDETVDLKQAREIDDALVFGDAKPYFYTATIFSPTIQQWSLDDAGDFVPGPVVSFANEGVMGTYSAGLTPIFSDEKSYFVDSDSAQVVVWNPKEVTFIKTIPIDVSLPEDHEGPADLTPTLEISVQKDRLLVSVFWNSFESGWTKFASFSRLVAIDPETDEVTRVTDETRCQSLSPVGTTSRGTTYYAPWDYHVAARAVFGDEHGVASCGLRVASTAQSYDEDYEVDLSALVDGRPAGTAFLMNDDAMLLHVWHEELSTATPENWTESGRWDSSYQWYRWSIGDDRAELLPNQPPSGEGGSWAKLDGRLISYSANPEYSETTLVELDADGTSTELLRIPGWTATAIRAR